MATHPVPFVHNVFVTEFTINATLWGFLMKSLFSAALVLVGFLSLTVLSGSLANAGIFDRVPSKTGNYCKDEVYEFMERRFPEVKVLSLEKVGGGIQWEMWMRTSACPHGYLVFAFNGIEGFNCTMGQYGSRTYFLRQVWAYGSCESLLPHPEYP